MPLLDVIRQQDVRLQQQDQLMDELKEELQRLKDEIAHLKGHKSRPKIRPSALEKGDSEKPSPKGKSRPGSKKRKKTATLEIHDRQYISVADVPPGSTFKGYQEYTVQDIEIHPHNTRYFMERWETPDGQILRGVLPESVQGGHFGPTLVSYILYQYNQCHMTQPLLLEALHEWGVDISAGQIDRLLTENKASFHAEKAGLLSAGLSVSDYIHVLERPEIPLHNNLSERDIREYVKRRNISGSTRSEKGRKARDTFISLKKTCRKLGISFWKYLQDRIGHLEGIPPLPELIQQQAQAP